MNLRAIREGLKNYNNWWFYGAALPLGAITAYSFYRGKPVDGVESSFYSLMLLYLIGKIHETRAIGSEFIQLEKQLLEDLRGRRQLTVASPIEEGKREALNSIDNLIARIEKDLE